MKKLAFFAVAAALAGCTPKLEITQPSTTAGIRADVDRARITSYRTTEIRTMTNRDGASVEVGGLSCTLSSTEVSASVITPARVDLPRFVQSGEFEDRGRPAQMQVRCEGDDLRGAETVFAQDKQVATATNAGIAGAILTTAVTAAVASSTPWKFPEVVSVTVMKERIN